LGPRWDSTGPASFSFWKIFVRNGMFRSSLMVLMET
jgi:hypothetical protein